MTVGSNISPKMVGPFDEAKNAFNEYNSLIRGFLRDVMGVKLEDRLEENSRGSIHVEILEMPEDNLLKSELEKEMNSFDFDEYSRIKSLRDNLKKTSSDFTKEPEKLYHFRLLIHCEQYLKKFDLNEILKRIIEKFSKEMFHSPFGVYNIKNSRISLYIKPIYFYCKVKNLNFKTFVILVLIHELAHGYSHIGLDKDRQSWEKIGVTDLNIVEGIAQYYTKRFFEKYNKRFNDGLSVFESLLEDQANCYKAFIEWQVSDEQLYRAFVELRRNGKTKTGEFKELIEASKTAIRNKSKI
jgi:hypothetical protein